MYCGWKRSEKHHQAKGIAMGEGHHITDPRQRASSSSGEDDDDDGRE